MPSVRGGPQTEQPAHKNRMPEGEQGQNGHLIAPVAPVPSNTGIEEMPRMPEQGDQNQALRSQIPVRISAK